MVLSVQCGRNNYNFKPIPRPSHMNIIVKLVDNLLHLLTVVKVVQNDNLVASSRDDDFLNVFFLRMWTKLC